MYNKKSTDYIYSDLTYWRLVRFAKNVFLDSLEILRVDMGHISSNLLKKALITWQHAFLSTTIAFYHILARACAEINVFRLLDF